MGKFRFNLTAQRITLEIRIDFITLPHFLRSVIVSPFCCSPFLKGGKGGEGRGNDSARDSACASARCSSAAFYHARLHARVFISVDFRSAVAVASAASR